MPEVASTANTHPPRWLRPALLVLSWLLLTGYFYSPAVAVLDVTLDSSNYGSYSAFTAQGRQYGPEVVPMAGPFGFVIYGTTYAGHLYWPRFFLELLTKASFSALLLWFFCAARSRVVRWLWLVGFIIILPGSELIYDFTVVLAGLYVVLNYERPGRLLASCAAVALLGFLALTKGTLLIFAFATLGLLALQAIVDRDFRRLGWLALTLLGSLFGFWLLAGQSPLNFPSFVHGINELSSGYNEAMGLQEPLATFVTGVGSLVLFWMIVVAAAWAHRRQVGTVLALVLLGGFSFLKWKHGFVRADGHVYLFYFFVALAAPTAWLIGRIEIPASRATTRSWNLALGVLTTVCSLLAYYGPGANPFKFIAWQVGVAAQRAKTNALNLASPFDSKQRLGTELNENRAAFTLPETQRVVGRASIDFFGIEHGYIPLNRLNYQPRPMSGGSFNVFTPELQSRNASHIANPATRPEFYLVNLQTIDNRLVAEDDGSALRVIAQSYEPVIAERGMLLLHARGASNEPMPPTALSSRAVRFGETVLVPKVSNGEMLLVSFELPPSLRGRLRSTLYKPPAVFIAVDGDGVRDPDTRRLVPPLVSSPMILSPLLEGTEDLLSLYSSAPGKTIRGFRVTTEFPTCFEEERLRVNFHVVARPKPIAPNLLLSLAPSLHYPIANRAPELVEPVAAPARMSTGLLIQPANAPARIVFALDGTERAVTFDYGLDPESYTRGLTDGVEFSVELTQPGGPTQPLFRQMLRPRTVVADHGVHQQRVILPPIIKPGSKLALRAHPGPAGDNAWDWSYYTHIQFQSGSYAAEQFPNFNVVPVEIAADFCGPMAQGDGKVVFMLNAPGQLTFALSGHESSLGFSGGLLEKAYTEGDTDGAEFVVTLRHADGRSEELQRRWLKPKSEPTDRGLQYFSIALPAHAAGDRLDLRTLPGPSGSIAWDWTFIAGLSLR